MRAMRRIIAVLNRLGTATGPRRLILPRVLRRPFRVLSRIEWRPSRHAELKLGAALFLATAIGGMVIGGHVESVVAFATANTGLSIAEVRITGQTETSEVDVLRKLAVGTGTSLATFDVAAARARIKTLPWVERATLSKLYPSTLQVAVAERAAFAIWHRGERVSLIDEAGTAITDAIDERYRDLPMVVGEGAGARAAGMIAMIAAEPALAARVNAAVLVAGRRWNILLDGGIEILLPETEPAAALRQVAVLDADTGLLSRRIVRVDLRNHDRPVLRLSEEGMAERQAILKRAKTAKRGPA